MHTDAILPARRMPLPPPPHPPVAALARASDPASDPTEVVGGLAPIDQVRQRVAVALFGATTSPTLVGRFQVSKLLGAGGMGVVYAAHDPQLGRTVAIKLLQPMAAGERARERLQREAQAMARLQHPNVVGVFETGIHGDQVFVAMEYVEGGTLGDWLRVRPRPWTEVVDMLCQAGDGLAAAHEVGLVHRDFKPANILISGARARISDFGLARAAADAGELERTSEDDGLLLASPLTRTGALIGTPAYMAPELLHGGAASPASDQFAFGVVLFEAVHGHRPFLGDSVPALLDAIESGKLATVAGKPAPAALTAIIRRALDRDPARRFPDMPALLTDLRAARSRGDLRLGFLAGMRELPRGRALALLMTSGLALVGGLALATFSQPSPPPLAPLAPPAPPAPIPPIPPIDLTASLQALAQLDPGTPGPPPRSDCLPDATHCAIDREFATALAGDAGLLIGEARIIPSVQDGRTRGAKLYGLRPDGTFKRLGFKNGDLITNIAGVALDDGTVAASEYVPALQRLLATGGPLRFERKGVTIERSYQLR